MSSCTALHWVAATDPLVEGALAAPLAPASVSVDSPEVMILFLGTPGQGEESLLNTRVPEGVGQDGRLGSDPGSS